MGDINETRRKLKMAFIALLSLDLIAVLVLFSPLVGSADARRQQLTQLWNQLRTETRQVEPLRGFDQKIVQARQEIDTFYKDRLPAQQSSISEAMGKLAAAHGVRITQAKYDTKTAESVGLQPVQIEAALSGDYLHLVQFINALERDKMFFIVNSVTLGDAQGGQVKLQLKLETYTRTGA
jgi:type IV pilus assembly protein PilO